jgi:hypothetical protein
MTTFTDQRNSWDHPGQLPEYIGNLIARWEDWTQEGDDDAVTEATFRDALREIRRMRDHWRAENERD